MSLTVHWGKTASSGLYKPFGLMGIRSFSELDVSIIKPSSGQIKYTHLNLNCPLQVHFTHLNLNCPLQVHFTHLNLICPLQVHFTHFNLICPLQVHFTHLNLICP